MHNTVVFSHSYYYKFDPKQWKNKTPFPPLGTIYAASYLRENGYEVGLFDTNLIDTPAQITPYLTAKKPSFFVLYDDGFNYLTKMCLTKMRTAAFSMIAIAKSLGCFVICASSDATDHYEKYLEKGADVIIKGEGEITLKEILDTKRAKIALKDIAGIIYKENDNIVKNKQRAVLKDLDVLPIPAWDLVDINAYKKIWKEGNKTFTLNIATTRGCPYKCNWCAKPIYGNRYNSHSPEYIAKHIAFLTENYGVYRFWMCDDIFGLKPNWVSNFNVALKNNSVKIAYYIQSRADLLVDENTVNALYESGLEEAWIGAESGSQRILDAMDKGTTIAQIEQATKLLKEKSIRIAFFIQFGYLTETKEDISKTIAMIKELVPDDIGISVSYPLPGTKFYDMVKDDLKAKANWTDSDDLAMLFNGTFNTDYYRKLQRYVHKEFRKSQGLENLKILLRNPLLMSKKKVRSAFLYFYYLVSVCKDRLILKNLKSSN